MIYIEIPGVPVPWRAHAGYGKRSFNPRFAERASFQFQIRSQYRLEPILGPVEVHYTFHMPIPEGTSKIKRSKMLEGKVYHEKRPDTTNLIKMYEDCLKGIVMKDDSQVCRIVADKIYSDTPKVVIKIHWDTESIEDEAQESSNSFSCLNQ